MNYPILAENQNKRQDKPLWMLICFALFSFWQMGFIYFVGPSLTIDGKTPLPIDMDNATALIVICYALSILWMIFLPRTVIWTQRISTGIALATAVGFFLPLPEDALRLLVYIQIFCCCLMIGFETFIIVNYFSERSNIKHLTVAYGIACLLIAIIQNELIPITFPTFRFIMVGTLILLLIFFLRMPTAGDVHPRYVKKSDGMTAPGQLMFGSCILIFVAALMGVSGPAIVDEIKNGVLITYLVDAIACFTVYLLYKKANFHPFRIIPVLVGLGSIGFLLMYASTYLPPLSYIACGLIGIGMVPCQILPLYGMVMMKSYPSKYISPIIIGLSLTAVIVQGSMVEAFRTAPQSLYLVYAVIMAVLVFLYMQIEPFFLFALRRRMTEDDKEFHREDAINDVSVESAATVSDDTTDDPFRVLTAKEKEVAELICLGYSNKDIAKVLFITEHTAKDHTKSIYRKTEVHSRIELATLVSGYRVTNTK